MKGWKFILVETRIYCKQAGVKPGKNHAISSVKSTITPGLYILSIMIRYHSSMRQIHNSTSCFETASIKPHQWERHPLWTDSMTKSWWRGSHTKATKLGSLRVVA